MQSQERAVATAHFTQPATVEAIAHARRWIFAFASEHGMAADRRRDAVLALSEAVTNVVRHAYDPAEGGAVALAAATDGEWLSVRVSDTGCGVQGPSLGMGLGLIEQLADRVEVGPVLEGRGTVVLMELALRSREEAAEAVRTTRARPARLADVASARRA